MGYLPRRAAGAILPGLNLSPKKAALLQLSHAVVKGPHTGRST
jgi:hypothetical protein